MSNESFPTSRVYARNSTMAFPKTTDYACSLERPCSKNSNLVSACKYLGITLVVTFSAALIAASNIGG